GVGLAGVQRPAEQVVDGQQVERAGLDEQRVGGRVGHDADALGASGAPGLALAAELLEEAGQAAGAVAAAAEAAAAKAATATALTAEAAAATTLAAEATATARAALLGRAVEGDAE